jgi:hypothetical protein
MSNSDVAPTTGPSAIANDNATVTARAEAALKRFLLAVGIYVLAATVGWAAVGVLVARWIFAP